jgi:hypothetical protein
MKRFKVRNDIQMRDAIGRFASAAGKLGRSPTLGIKSRVGRAALAGHTVGGFVGFGAGATGAMRLIKRIRKKKKNKGLTLGQKASGLGILGAGIVGGDYLGKQIGKRSAAAVVRGIPRARSLAKGIKLATKVVK